VKCGDVADALQVEVVGRLSGLAPCCGDGIVEIDLGEQCDLGQLNGVPLDANGNPTYQAGCPLCTTGCAIPFCLL
jgi:hypothetical protein